MIALVFLLVITAVLVSFLMQVVRTKSEAKEIILFAILVLASAFSIADVCLILGRLP